MANLLDFFQEKKTSSRRCSTIRSQETLNDTSTISDGLPDTVVVPVVDTPMLIGNIFDDDAENIPPSEETCSPPKLISCDHNSVAVHADQPAMNVKRLRPFSADQLAIKPKPKKKRVHGRLTVAGVPTVEDIRPTTPLRNPLARRSPRTLDSMLTTRKRMYDHVSTSLPLLELIFHSKFPTLRLTFSRRLSSDSEFIKIKKEIRNWCHEIKNPTKGLCRPAIDINYVDPPSSVDGLSTIHILVAHPDETLITEAHPMPSLDILCTLAKGGMIFHPSFIEAYNTGTVRSFPPDLPSQYHLKDNHDRNNATPLRTHSPYRSPHPSICHSPISSSIHTSEPLHLPGEHPAFPSVLTRHPTLCGSKRPLMDGMVVALVGEFTSPFPPFSIMKILLKHLGVVKVVTETEYRSADLVICGPHFKRSHLDLQSVSDGQELSTPEDELKFLLYWRRRNIDGGRLDTVDGKEHLFRLPRNQLFKDYTPLRVSNITPYRDQLTAELSDIRSSQADTNLDELSGAMESGTPEPTGRANGDDCGDGFLDSCRGKIFVKASWLVHSMLNWQLEVPHLFLPLALKTRRKAVSR